MATILDLPEMRERVYRWAVSDYVRLTEENPAFKHSELIHGIIVEKMSKGPLHISLTKRLYDYFLRHAPSDWTVRQEAPLRLVDSMPEPDISVVLGEERDYLAKHPTTATLVIEVATSSVAPDRENASLYAEAAVAEYWIVLGEKQEIEVYRQPGKGVYQSKRTYLRGESIEGVAVLGEAFAVDTLFA